MHKFKNVGAWNRKINNAEGATEVVELVNSILFSIESNIK